MPRSETVWLEDMCDAVKRVLFYVAGMDEATFAADFMRVDAVVRQLEVLGEACKSVSEATRKAHPDVPWRQIAHTRDRLIHSYFAVDVPIVWDIASQNLPPLLAQLDAILEGENSHDA